MIRIVLPVDPVPQHRARHGKTRDGHPITYSDQKLEETHWRLLIRERYRGKPLAGAVRLRIQFLIPMPKSWRPKRRQEMVGKPHLQTPDVSNLTKAVEDWSNGLLWEDDRLICSIIATKLWATTGAVMIEAEEVPS